MDIPTDNPLHHKGVVGSILAVMFGYTVNTEWMRVIVHLTYLAIALPLVFGVYKKPIVEEKQDALAGKV